MILSVIVSPLAMANDINTHALLFKTCVIRQASQSFIPIICSHLALQRQYMEVFKHLHHEKCRRVGETGGVEFAAQKLHLCTTSKMNRVALAIQQCDWVETICV